jgi:hypothetical protein
MDVQPVLVPLSLLVTQMAFACLFSFACLAGGWLVWRFVRWLR